MAEVTKGSNANKPPKFDPDKNYKWQPEDKFTLTGLEFAQLYQTINAEVSLPHGSVSAKQKMAAFRVLEGIVAQAVEAGVAVEDIPQQQPSFEDELSKIGIGRNPNGNSN